VGEAPSRFPLAWPAHKPRTSWDRRRRGKFSASGRTITMKEAITRAMAEVARLGGTYGLISSNVALRLDGLPKSGQGEPADPGVCLYFQIGGKPYAMACDVYDKVAQNLAAIAAHIEATRAITRHGVATAAETLQAFAALAAPAPRSWRDVLELSRDAGIGDVRAALRRLAQIRHPDKGGSEGAMAELNAARDAAEREVGA
jgi:hypothetical protein